MDPLDNIIMEILSRLPKLVRITHDSFYKHLHAQRHGQILDGFLLKTNKEGIISYIPAPDNPSFEFSLSFLTGTPRRILAVAPNGFLLCEIWHPRRDCRIYCICKPATQQWMHLPLPKTRYRTLQMAMTVLRSNPLHFKIFRLSMEWKPAQPHGPYNERVICELFDSKTWMWKRLHGALLQTYYQQVEFWEAGVSASGSVHWKTIDNTIFALHFEKENWSIIAMPDPIRSSNNLSAADSSSSIRLAEYEGKLAVMRSTTVVGDHHREATAAAARSVEVWVMEHYRNKTWTKTFVVPIPMVGYLRDDFPLAFYGSDTVVELLDTRLVFYEFDHGNCSCSSIRRTYLKSRGSASIYRFSSDFEPCTFVVPRGRFSPQAMAKMTNTDVCFS